MGDLGALRIAEAAELLGISRTTTRRWADAGRLPCYRLPSGHRRFDLHAVIRLRDELRTPAVRR